MVDDATLAAELHPLLEPLHKRIQELGYRLVRVELAKINDGEQHDFADCSTDCGWQSDGTYGCRTHCP